MSIGIKLAIKVEDHSSREISGISAKNRYVLGIRAKFGRGLPLPHLKN